MANKTTIRERLATLESTVKLGFENVNNKFNNHLSEHKDSERFHKRIIITLIGIIGSLCVGIIIIAIKYFSMKG